jgi:hypothetical protein
VAAEVMAEAVEAVAAVLLWDMAASVDASRYMYYCTHCVFGSQGKMARRLTSAPPRVELTIDRNMVPALCYGAGEAKYRAGALL